ncbi:hypothetical protein [Arthrobacter zhaoguopingii]|uniref:hypothetical protein n=1 Tax=Arthrobacter zhaoguopingii TaxID=2681491 RepID=UPI001359C5F1|nr:hypothetical protein [Arthrobacter zhaoguopingii]
MRFLITVSLFLLLAFLPALPAAASTAGTTATPQAEADLTLRLLDIPADTQDDPRARSYIIDRLPPGAQIERRIHLENNTPTAQIIRLYAGAARIDGGLFVGEDAGVRNELSTWTTLADPEVSLEPGQSREVLTTIAVPVDAPEGEQYGAVWAEMRSPADEGGVVQANRVGIRIFLSVGPGNGPPADFAIGSLTTSRDEEGRPQLGGLVTNTGGRALDVSGSLSLTEGPGALSAGPFAVQSATTIAPGTTHEVTFILPKDLPNGPWIAGLKLTSGLLEREASTPVTFPEAGAGETITPPQAGTNPWIPHPVLAAVLLLALAGTALLIRRRKRQPHRRH